MESVISLVVALYLICFIFSLGAFVSKDRGQAVKWSTLPLYVMHLLTLSLLILHFVYVATGASVIPPEEETTIEERFFDGVLYMLILWAVLAYSLRGLIKLAIDEKNLEKSL